MKLYKKIKFPCGYEYVIEIQTGLFEMGHIKEDIDDKSCPLHDKDCLKKMRKWQEKYVQSVKKDLQVSVEENSALKNAV